MKLSFDIGDIVRLANQESVLDRYIVLATKEQDLNEKFINELTGEFLIKDINKIARARVTVNSGFDYKIGYILKRADGIVQISKYIDVFEGDIYR